MKKKNIQPAKTDRQTESDRQTKRAGENWRRRVAGELFVALSGFQQNEEMLQGVSKDFSPLVITSPEVLEQLKQASEQAA